MMKEKTKTFIGLILSIICMVLILLISGVMIETRGDSTNWVLISPRHNFSEFAEDDRGKSKKGDVVAVMPCTSQYEPTDAEKSKYIILNVSGIDDDAKEMLLLPYQDSEGNTLAYRKSRVDIDMLGLTEPGIIDGLKDYCDYLSNSIKTKTEEDLVKYEEDRQKYAN